MEMKVTGSGPMESSRKRNQGSSWAVAPAEEEEEEEEDKRELDWLCTREIKNAYRRLSVKLKGDHLEGPGLNRKIILK
jgi:hypothetical protein